MPITFMGGVTITVDTLRRCFPKLGVLSRSSIVTICNPPALKPAKPNKDVFSIEGSGHVLTRASRLLALALGLNAILPRLGALYLRWPIDKYDLKLPLINL